MKSIVKEFRDFISKGNAIDLAIGVMMGNAFNTIINSMINDIFMPVIGLLTSGVSFDSWFIPLDGNTYANLAAAKAANAPIITIGSFLSAILNFLIVALVLFLIMKAANRASVLVEKAEKKVNGENAADQPKPKPSDEVALLTEIRDLLAKQNTAEN